MLDDDRSHSFVCEIKWTSKPVRVSLLDRLRQRVRGETSFAGVDVTYAVLSRSGFVMDRKVAGDERLVDARTFPLHIQGQSGREPP
jgi:hypothetical protein